MPIPDPGSAISAASVVLALVLVARVTGLLRTSGAAAWWVLGTGVWLVGGPSPATVLLVAVAAVHGTDLICRVGDRTPTPARLDLGGVGHPISMATVALATCVAARLSAAPGPWLAAFTGAVAAPVADVLAGRFGARFGDGAHGLPTLRPTRPGSPGAVTGSGTLAAATIALALAATAWNGGLLAPGDGAPVAVAAFLATLLEGTVHALRHRGEDDEAGRPSLRERHLMDLVLAVGGAAMAGGLVAWLP